jgi:hypothetical protein
MLATVLLVQASYAQPAPIPGQSPKEKAREEQKRARDKDAEGAYKSSLDSIPDAGKNTDPWGKLRTPSAPSSAGPK